MGIKRVPIAEASAAQLREHARDVLGLQDVKDNATKAQLIALIGQAWAQDHVLVSDAVDTTMDARRAAKGRFSEETPDSHPETVVVQINIEEGPGGDRPVELAVNGKNMLIERGKDQEIPWPYYLVLKNAEQHFHDPLPIDPGAGKLGGIHPVPRIVRRYPFQRVA